jgi:hypothetical protein
MSSTDSLTSLPPIIDCPYDGVRAWIIVFAVIAVVILLAVVLLPNYSVAVVPIAVAITLLGALGCWVVSEQKLDATLDPKLGVPTRQAIQNVLTPRWFTVRTGLRSMVQRLSTLGCRGVTARIGNAKDLTPVRPIKESFEPIPLDETGNLFSQLEPDAGQNSTDAPATTSSLMRNIRLGGGWLMIAPFSLLLLMGVIESIRSKRISPNLIQWSVMTLIVLLGIGKGAQRSRFQWFLVPGGLVVRRTRRWKKEWQIELYKRAESVLVLRSSNRIWAAHVANPEHNAKASMTQREAQMLLRAWLSPLPTPPLEQLSDLT